MSAGASRSRGAPPEPQSSLPTFGQPHPSVAATTGAAPAAATPLAPLPPQAPPPRRTAPAAVRLAPPLTAVAVLFPAALIAWRTLAGHLGADPVETLEHATGDWAIRFLALTLLVTPVRQATGWGWLVRIRRTLGLATFGYATLHLLVYVVIDQGLLAGEIVRDVLEHPWVTFGMLGWLLLLPLAVTSTRGWVRRLGGQRWQRLHRLVYLVPVSVTLHYFWAVKQDVRLPILFGAIFSMLLGVRLWRELARRRAR